MPHVSFDKDSPILGAIKGICVAGVYIVNGGLKESNSDLYYFIKDRLCEIIKRIET